MFSLNDYQFDLPESSIAQTPMQPARASRLLVCGDFDDDGASCYDAHFSDLPALLSPEHVLFFNNTRVLKARIRLKNIVLTKPTGESDILEEGEILYLEKISEQSFHALVRPGKKFKI